MRRLRNILATTLVVMALIGGTAGAAAAAPDRGDGPQTDEEKNLQNACQTAYDTMEWAKARRQLAGDVWDQIADGAYWFLNNFCDDVHVDTAHIPAPKGFNVRVATAKLDSAHDAVDIEPFDNPVAPGGVSQASPLNGRIGS